jgi:hypothetical protein
MYYQPDDVFMSGIREDGVNVWNCSFPANYADGSWHHYVMTVDSSGNNHYVDGTKITCDYQYGGDASTQAFFNSVTGLNTLRMGNREDSGGTQYHFGGNLDEVRISKVARSEEWLITSYGNQSATNKTSSYSECDPDAACFTDDTGLMHINIEESSPQTVVNLINFTAKGEGNSVKVAWETAQEIDNMGFNLYRAESPAGPYTRLNESLIPGSTFSVKGKKYSYMDSSVTRGKLYYYRLEDINVRGKKTLHGPICVDWDGDGMPDDWEIVYGLNPLLDDAHMDPDGDGLSNLDEYERETDPP